MAGPTTETPGVAIDVKAELIARIEAEHRQRLEYARIEHEARMELIRAEADLVDEKYRRLAVSLMPGDARLRKLAGTFTAPPGTFGADEEMPY